MSCVTRVGAARVGCAHGRAPEACRRACLSHIVTYITNGLSEHRRPCARARWRWRSRRACECVLVQSKKYRHTSCLGWHSWRHTGHSPCTHERHVGSIVHAPCPGTTIRHSASRRYGRTAWWLATFACTNTAHSACRWVQPRPPHRRWSDRFLLCWQHRGLGSESGHNASKPRPV